jgi:hypothetical protein
VLDAEVQLTAHGTVAPDGENIARGLSHAPQADANLQRVISGMLTPGDPAYESLKAALMQINDLAHYESYGYATFLFIRWKWDLPIPGCHTDVIRVPEGYGIPYVARAAASSLAATRPLRPVAFPMGFRPGGLILIIANVESRYPSN